MSLRVCRMRRCRSRSQVGWPITGSGLMPTSSLTGDQRAEVDLGIRQRRPGPAAPARGSTRTTGGRRAAIAIDTLDRSTPSASSRNAQNERSSSEPRTTIRSHVGANPAIWICDVVLVRPEPVRVVEHRVRRPACCARRPPPSSARCRSAPRASDRTPGDRGARRRRPRTRPGIAVSSVGPTGMPPGWSRPGPGHDVHRAARVPIPTTATSASTILPPRVTTRSSRPSPSNRATGSLKCIVTP